MTYVDDEPTDAQIESEAEERDRFDPNRIRLSIATNLREIERMYADLEIEALYQADDPEIPGGDALNLAGPVANVEAWQHRYDTAEARGFGRHGDYVVDQVDAEDHPLLVLATWEDVLRDECDQPSDLRTTIARASAYIASKVEWMLGTNEYGDLNFLGIDALARDLSRVRSRLEAVLNDGIRSTKGVPCMACGTALVRIWGESEALDRWQCKPCDEQSTLEQYALAVKADYRAHAEALTASDIEKEFRVRPGTLRQWQARGLVKKRGRDASGRLLYDVADTLAQRDRDTVGAVL